MLIKNIAFPSRAILFDRAFGFGAAESDAIGVSLLGCPIPLGSLLDAVEVDDLDQGSLLNP